MKSVEEKRKQRRGESKGGCHNSEGGGVLETVVIATIGQTQETAGGDDVTREK